MSYDFPMSDTERMHFGGSYPREPRVNHQYNREEKERLRLTKEITGLSNNIQIKNKILKQYLLKHIDNAIDEYSSRESLPFEFSIVAIEKNALEIMIKGFLRKVGGYQLTNDLILEIQTLVDNIYRNDDLEIVYTRVNKVQHFIHQKVDAKQGENSHQNLNKKHMRNLLSAARLHLNIMDIEYKDINTLSYIFEQSSAASQDEMNNKEIKVLPNGKRYIRTWRVRHLRSLFSFYSTDEKQKFQNILKIDTNKPSEVFIKEILDEYLKYF